MSLDHEPRPIIALDFPSFEDMKEFLAKFPEDEELFVKLGMELYYQEGPEILRYVKSLGHSVFLDLKLHDIPNTVKFAMKGLAKLGVDIATVHAAGGVEMMAAAKAGLAKGTPEGTKLPKLIAITQLTSTSEEMMRREQLVAATLEESVINYAKMAKEAGLDGVVSSALEVAKIKEATHADFINLTPGIRPTGAAVGDQKRVVTPKQAREIGSTYIVVGRPITQSEDPVATYSAIKQEWND